MLETCEPLVTTRRFPGCQSNQIPRHANVVVSATTNLGEHNAEVLEEFGIELPEAWDR